MTFVLHDAIHAGEGVLRVLRVTPSIVMLIDVGDESSWPEVWPYEDALECLRSGAWSSERGVAPEVMLDTQMSEAVRRKRDVDWAIIAGSVEDPRIFDPGKRGALIAELAPGPGMRPSAPTVRRLLRLYFHRGMCPSALAASYHRSGAPGKTRTPGKAKRGAPATLTDREGVNVGEEERRAFEMTMRKTYGADGRHDLPSAYRHYLAHHASIPDPNRVGGLVYIGKYAEKGPPTFRQFVYWAKKGDWELTQRRRQSDRVYEMQRRPLVGTSTAEAFGPCSRFQIDATILRVYVRSRLNRRHIVGRPVLYVIIDVFSRMIVGVDLSFENASWIGAMTALASCVEDKVELCARYGITIAPDQWPVRHMCGALLGDNGELKRTGLDNFIESSRTHVQNATAWRADYKGIVERRFGLFETAMGHCTPGFVEPDFMERGARDYRGEAVLDLDDVWANLLEIVLNYNNVHELKGYPSQPGQVEDDVPSVPAELWLWGIANRTGSPRTPEPERFRFSLLPVAEAVSTRRGLLFEGRFYAVRDLALQRTLAGKAIDGRFKVRISHDKRDVGRVYVHHKASSRGFVLADLTDASVAHRGSNAWESHGLTVRAKMISAERLPAADLERAAMERRMEGRSGARRAEIDSGPDLGSLPSQVRDMRNRRAEEKAVARVDNAARFAPAPDPIDGASGADRGARPGEVVPLLRRGASFSTRAMRRAHAERGGSDHRGDLDDA